MKHTLDHFIALVCSSLLLTAFAVGQETAPTKIALPEPVAPAAAPVPGLTPAPAVAVAPATTAAMPAGQGIRLNFQGASLSDVLNYLSEAAGFVIVQETPVSGTVFCSVPSTVAFSTR